MRPTKARRKFRNCLITVPRAESRLCQQLRPKVYQICFQISSKLDESGGLRAAGRSFFSEVQWALKPCQFRAGATAFFELTPDASLVRRVFIENCAESVFVVAKPPAMRFGEGSDLRFALSAIVGPNTGQVRFVNRAMFCFL